MIQNLALIAILSLSAPDAAMSAADKAAFVAAFREASTSGCISKTKKDYPADDNIPAFCSCATEKILATKSVAEIARGFTPEEYRPIVVECLKENPPPNLP
jgi:hypothetical protein